MIGKIISVITQLFGGQVSGTGATSGQALVKKSDGSWGPGTVTGSTPKWSDTLAAGGGTTTSGNNPLVSTGDLLRFGGTSSSFAALKPSGTSLKVRLADDSADTSLTASLASLTSTGIAVALDQGVIENGVDANGDGTVGVDPNNASSFSVARASTGYSSSYVSGTHQIMEVSPLLKDNGTNSTTVGRTLVVTPEIDYTAATKTGHYEAIVAEVKETGLPTGTNLLLALRAGAAGTTDKFAVSNKGEIQLVGSGGTAGQVLSSGGAGASATWATVTPTAAACTYRLTSAQAMTNNTLTLLSGFTKVYDSNTGGSDFYAGGAPTNFVIPVSGRYLVVGMIFFDSSTNGVLRLVQLKLNGAFYTTIASASPDSVASPAVGCIVLNLTAGDVLAFGGYQDSGGNLNALTGAIQGANATYVSIASIGDSQGSNGNGVTSLVGTANQVTVSGSTGAVTLSLPSSIIVANNVADTSQTLHISKLPGSNVASFGGDGLVVQMSASNQQVTVGSETAAGASGIILGDTNVTVPPNSFRSFIDLLMNGSNRNGFTMWRSEAAAGAGANFQGNRSRGTTAVPTNVSAGDVCLSVLSGGYNSGISGNGYVHNGVIQFQVDPAGTPSATSMPACINFAVIPDGSIATAPVSMSLRSTGFLTMGSGRVIGFSSNADPTLAVLDGCIYRDSAGVTAFGTTSANAAGTFKATNGILLGKLTTYNNVATAGAGVAPVRANTNVTAQTGAATVATFHTTADGDFYVSGQVSVTTATGLSTSLNCTYTDVTGASVTAVLPIATTGGSFLSGGLITATGTYESTVLHIRAKTGTDITIATAAGTFVNVTYSASGSIISTTV